MNDRFNEIIDKHMLEKCCLQYVACNMLQYVESPMKQSVKLVHKDQSSCPGLSLGVEC